jgi:hypothetical protein
VDLPGIVDYIRDTKLKDAMRNSARGVALDLLKNFTAFATRVGTVRVINDMPMLKTTGGEEE